MNLFYSSSWTDYELIDTGGFEKLERFGSQVVARPEPQAIWDKSLGESEWQKLADAYFKLHPVKSGSNQNASGNERGEWQIKTNAQQQWYINYISNEMKLKFRLGLTSFSHIGLFPEQVSNWNFIFDTITNLKQSPVKVLNLFAYTGGASLAAKAAGADVTHVDSVKQVITWARENMELSGLNGIRWIVEDAVKFVNREVRRGNKYQGIILDPPAYGRGAEGEKWILEDSINNLLKSCRELLDDHGFVILNLYSMGFSSLIAQNLLTTVFRVNDVETGELFLPDNAGRKLPLGVLSRFQR